MVVNQCNNIISIISILVIFFIITIMYLLHIEGNMKDVSVKDTNVIERTCLKCFISPHHTKIIYNSKCFIS